MTMLLIEKPTIYNKKQILNKHWLESINCYSRQRVLYAGMEAVWSTAVGHRLEGFGFEWILMAKG